MSEEQPKLPKGLLKQIVSMMTGKHPDEINIDERMAIGRKGDIRTNYEVESKDGDSIVFEYVSMEDLEDMHREKLEQTKIFLREQYQRMGLIDDFREQFPFINEFELIVLKSVPDIAANDFIFACGQMGRLSDDVHEELDRLNNFRICRTSLDEETEKYRWQKNQVCCETFDKVIHNPDTGNRFLIGCNHGHYWGDV